MNFDLGLLEKKPAGCMQPLVTALQRMDGYAAHLANDRRMNNVVEAIL